MSGTLTFEQRFFRIIDWSANYLTPPLLVIMGSLLIVVSHTGENLEWMEHVFRYGGFLSFFMAGVWLSNVRFERLEQRIAQLEAPARRPFRR